MKIGIVGSRRRNKKDDYGAIRKAFLEVWEKAEESLLEGEFTLEIVSGGCPQGGDQFAEILSDAYGVPITVFPAQWDKHGKAAGFIRNTDIADNSDVLIACVASDRKGGTEDTIKKFLKRQGLTEEQAVKDGLLILV